MILNRALSRPDGCEESPRQIRQETPPSPTTSLDALCHIVQDNDGVARVWLDSTLRPLAANTAALIESRRNDIYAFDDRGKLKPATDKLNGLIRDVMSRIGSDGSEVQTVRWLTTRSEDRVLVSISPVLAGSPPVMMALQLALCRPGAPKRLAGRTLVDLFRMTTTEAALAIQILEGKSLSDIATGRGVANSTVRSQLRAIFRKTSTARQSELITLLHQIAAT